MVDLKDMVILDIMNDVFYPKEDTLNIWCWDLKQKYVMEVVVGS